MDFFKKHQPKIETEKPEIKPASDIPTEERLSPFLENKLNKNSQPYDGNEALAREPWLENTDPETIKLLSILYNENKLKYSKEKIAQALATLKEFRSVHDFDIKYITGKPSPTRLNLFPPTIKTTIIKDILSGSFSTFDEKYLSRKIQGGKEQLEKIKNTTKRDKENQARKEKNRLTRVSEFEESGLGSQELLTTECPTLIVETHADNNFSKGALENIDQTLPSDIDRKLLRINYQEGFSMEENDFRNAKPSAYQEITDRSGEIKEEFLAPFIKEDAEVNIVLTGGNLRGCLSASLESIIAAIEKNKPAQVDLHLLLDKTYDDSSYDQIGQFPTDLLKSKSKLSVEIYKDGNIIDVSASNTTKAKTRVRLYLWSSSENFSQKLADSLDIKKLREELLNVSSSINDSPEVDLRSSIGSKLLT